jgi:hypothetical protein
MAFVFTPTLAPSGQPYTLLLGTYRNLPNFHHIQKPPTPILYSLLSWETF